MVVTGHNDTKYMIKNNTSDEWEEMETKHKALLKRLKQNFKNGDWTAVSIRTGLHKDNCASAFRRIHSKNHSLVVATLREVINERIKNLNHY